ncbi:unnamed protein product [Auanema sp. JU1783]|nr:unnamed protein product [Auanema sp. JU1783]
MLGGSISNPLYFFSSTSITSSVTDTTVRLTDVMDFFFIAHPLSGRKEGEEEKRIMYFSPKFDSVDRQTEVTGFAEAIVNFTNNFVDPKGKSRKTEFPFRTVSTKKTDQVYIQVENEEFLIGVSLLKSQCETFELYVFPPAIITVLSNCYKMFRLFFGEFSPFRNKNEEKFKERLDYFFSRFLPQLRLHKVQLLDYMDGAAFLPLPGPRYLSTVTLASEIKEEFPVVEKILMLYQNKLLYYTVSTKDLPSIFRYLSDSLLPSSIGSELDPTRSPINGRFLRGPSDLHSDGPLEGEDVLPTVHLHSPQGDDEEEVLLPYQMIVYRCMNATVCMFVRADMTRKSLRNLDAFLSTELTTLASEISESLDDPKKLNEAEDFHYIYYNPSSLSLTSSFDSGPGPATPPMDVNRLVCETMEKYISKDEDFGEAYVKSDSNWWILLKKMNSRILCLILPPDTPHSQSLAEAQLRTDSIIRTHFEAIFFH